MLHRIFRTFQIPLSWGELLKRTWRESSADNCLGLAAQLAYYFLLALAPAIVCVLALTSFFPPRLIEDLLGVLGRFAPGEVVQILRTQLGELSAGEDVGLLTFGLLMALWSSSAAMVAITDALNRAYDIEEGRPWWSVRLTAIFLTIGVAVFIVLGMGLVMFGPTLAEQLAARMGLGGAFAITWKILQWPVVIALVAVGIGLVYYFAPDAEQEWEWVTPGAVLATTLWLIASLTFKFYVQRFANYQEAYGSLGGVIVLMLWFYLSALAILVGAEMNAEIEHASPHGKAPGEKVPGQKKKIGAAAARDYEKRMRGGSPAVQPAAAAAASGGERVQPSIATYVVLGLFLVKRLFERPDRSSA